MEFLNPKKKRAHLRRLYIGYGLMAVALITGTFILVFAAYGYDIDRKTGGVIQNGLITIDAHPESAEIIINNVPRGTTADRLVLPAGEYDVTLRREGYRSWSHKVSLEGSTIEQLAYPFLFPNVLNAKNLQQYPVVPSMISESPDKRWLLLKSPSSPSAFDLVDLTNSKNPLITVSLPNTILTEAEGEHIFEAVEWSKDNVHLLVKHVFNGGQEFIMLDRNNALNSLNITKLFVDQQFTSVSMRDKKADQLYLFDMNASTLDTADTQTKTVVPILTQVLRYKSFQADTIAYVKSPAVTSPNNVENVELHLRQNGQDHLIRTLPISDNYLLDMAQFNGNFYAVAGGSKDGRTYVYKNPLSDLKRRPAIIPQPFRVLIVPSAEYVSFSSNTRFVAVQQANNFAVFDIETARQFRYISSIDIPAHQKATWMDGHRLSAVSGGFVHIFDFDGTNSQKLVPGLPAYQPFFDRDYTAMFVLAPVANSAEKSVLTRTELKVAPGSQNKQ